MRLELDNLYINTDKSTSESLCLTVPGFNADKYNHIILDKTEIQELIFSNLNSERQFFCDWYLDISGSTDKMLNVALIDDPAVNTLPLLITEIIRFLNKNEIIARNKKGGEFEDMMSETYDKLEQLLEILRKFVPYKKITRKNKL